VGREGATVGQSTGTAGKNKNLKINLESTNKFARQCKLI